MKHLTLESIKPFSVLFISLILCAGEAWGADVTLFSTDFSSTDWEGITTICSENNAADESYNGITFHSQNSTAKPFSIDNTEGTMTWCNNNMGNKFYIAIPISNVNGAITISVSNGTSNTRFNYVTKAESAISGSPGSGTGSTAGAPSSVTISSLTASNYVVYLGRNGSGMTTITSITITTPGPDCSATQPGPISKGTVSGGVITLTASGTPGTGEVWYWQSTADGTEPTESGASKDVMTAGTYYIRSYKASETCWSAATSVTVEEEDFYTPCETPHISVHPNSAEATYNRGDAATALSVTASVGDGGTLSYQWYSN